MSSGQLGVVPKGPISSNKIITPSTKAQVQIHRDESADGAGKYYGKLGNTGIEELIGGPGAGSGIPFGNDSDVAANNIQVTLTGFTSLTDGYTFEVRNLTTNTGATTLQIAASGSKAVVDTDGNPLVGGELVDTEIYIFAYNLTNDNFELLGLAKPSSGGPWEAGAGANSAQLVGSGSLANGVGSVAEGLNNTNDGPGASAEGQGNTITNAADSSHVEGSNNTVSGVNAHGQGTSVHATGAQSDACGNDTTSSGTNSHSGGTLTLASGAQSMADGISCQATAANSSAKGNTCIASAAAANASGNGCTASGANSNATGQSTLASQLNSTAEGFSTIASGQNSRSQGVSSRATHFAEDAQASGAFLTAGDSQRIMLTGRVETTNDTATEIFINGVSSLFTLLLNNGATMNVWKFTVNLSAMFTNGASIGDVLSRQFQGVIKNIGATTTLLVNTTPAASYEIQSAQDAGFGVGTVAAVVGNDTNDALRISVAGPTGTTDTIRWSASVEIVQTQF